MPGPHSQRLWTQAFQPLSLPILRPHQDTFSLTNLDQTGQTFRKFLVHPTSLILSLLLSPANTSQGNTHYSLSIQITEIWGNTMRLLTFNWASTAAPPFFDSILMTSHQIHSFIHSANQAANHHKIESYALLKHHATPVKSLYTRGAHRR